MAQLSNKILTNNFSWKQVENGNIGPVIQSLLALQSSDSSDLGKIRYLSSKYNFLEKEYKNGRLSWEKYWICRNQIVDSLIQFLIEFEKNLIEFA